MKGRRESNGSWYIVDWLLVPRITDLQETLFRLAHNTLGHFGVYMALRDAYYCVMNWNTSITLLLFLISVMDLSVCFPPNYYSYPFCTAQYGLTIFQTITRTVLSSTLTVFSNAHLLT